MDVKKTNPNNKKEGCPFKRFNLEELLERPLLQPLKEGERTFGDEAIEFSDEESDEEDEGDAATISELDRRRRRHEFSEELRKRGYVIIYIYL